MKTTTARLLKLREAGHVIAISAPPYAGRAVTYVPRSKYDSKPWEYEGYRYSAGELHAVQPSRPEGDQPTTSVTCPDGVVRTVHGILTVPGEPDRYETTAGAWRVSECEPTADATAKTPAVAIARILRGMGLKQGGDFSVRGYSERGERLGTMVVLLNRAANILVDEKADEIERLSEESTFPFHVSTEYTNGKAWPTLGNFGKRVRRERPAIDAAPVEAPVSVVANALRTARRAGFVTTHYYAGTSGTTQLVHDNGNILFITFAKGYFTSAEGRGWGDAPWTGVAWFTEDHDEFVHLVTT